MEHHIQDRISPLQPRQDLQLPTQAMSSYGHDQPEVSLSFRKHKNLERKQKIVAFILKKFEIQIENIKNLVQNYVIQMCI